MPCKVLGACGPGSLRSWQLAGFISASSNSSLLSFSLFSFPGSPGGAGKPAAPQHLWDPRSPLVPTCLLCSGVGETRGQGQHLVKLPSVFSPLSIPACMALAGRAGPTLPVSPRGWEKPWRTPTLPRSRQTPFFGFSAEVARSWCRARGQCRLHHTVVFMPGDAKSESRARGSPLRSRARGCLGDRCPTHSSPSPRQKGKNSQLNN